MPRIAGRSAWRWASDARNPTTLSVGQDGALRAATVLFLLAAETGGMPDSPILRRKPGIALRIHPSVRLAPAAIPFAIARPFHPAPSEPKRTQVQLASRDTRSRPGRRS